MKEILKRINKKGQEFAQLELFNFFQNPNLSQNEKMLWVPYFSPFVIEFAELNKNLFRKEPTNDKLQRIINQHTYEDECHWIWFLQDIDTLGLNKSLKFTDSLKLLWGEETKYTRQICQQIAIHTANVEPVIVMIAIKCLEKTFEIGLSAISPVIEELEKVNDSKFHYFGKTHTEVEKNHSNHSKDIQMFLENIELTSEQTIFAKEIVDLVFQLMTDSMNELLVNVRRDINNAKHLEYSHSI